MLKNENKFSNLSDEALVHMMTSPVVDEKLHEYFIYVKCAPFLRYLTRRLYGCNDITLLAGELYEFMAEDNWAVLRKWENRNEASLNSYIARCATNHFVNKEIKEKKRQEREALASDPEIIEHLANITFETENEQLPIWQAYNMLNERDREVLRLLVIEECQVQSVADKIWKYVDSKKEFSQLSPKRIQGTISMIKQRAQLTLLENLEKLSRN